MACFVLFAYKDITIRYWLTVEDFAPLNTNLVVDWAQLGTGNVKMRYVELPQPRQGALGYIEYRFDASAGSLNGNKDSGPIQSRIGKNDWTAFNEGDDYSYANAGRYTKNNRIMAYLGDQLVWGTEPQSVTVIPVEQSLKVYSETKSNSISTYVQLRHVGNVPVSYGDLKVRYYFTAEGSQPLNFYLDYAQLGNGKVKGTIGKLNPAVGKADSYLELSFTGLGNLYPLSSTGNIQYRIAKSDWSNFNQTNDHSYQPTGPLVENPMMVVYLNGTRVYGTEPSGANARMGLPEVESALQVVVLGNPILGDAVNLEVRGAGGQPLHLQVVDMKGRLVTERQIGQADSVERQQLSIGNQPAGLFLLRASTPTQVQTVKLIKSH